MSRASSAEMKEPPRVPHFKVDSSRILEEHYNFGKKLGEGTFGVVVAVEDKKDKTRWAIKKIVKERKSTTKSWEREIHILRNVVHPCIICLREIVESDHHAYLVMELCDGGTLNSELHRRGKFAEVESRHIISQLASAVSYLHKRSIVHRDIKLDNLLVMGRYGVKEVRSENCLAPPGHIYSRSRSLEKPANQSATRIDLLKPSGPNVSTSESALDLGGHVLPGKPLYIKLSDFGLSVELKKMEDTMLEFCGTPVYMAPEIISGKSYSKQCDVWSIGIIILLLLTGKSPFKATRQDELYDEIRDLNAEKLEIPDTSPRAKKCLCRLLHREPAYRLSASELTVDSWITGTEMNGNTTTNVLELMKEFHSSSKKSDNGDVALSIINTGQVVVTVPQKTSPPRKVTVNGKPSTKYSSTPTRKPTDTSSPKNTNGRSKDVR